MARFKWFPILQRLLHAFFRKAVKPFKLRPTLALKLSLGFSVIVLIFSAVAIFNHLKMTDIEDSLAAARSQAERQQTAIRLESVLQELDTLAAGYMVSGKPELLDRYQELVPSLESLIEKVGATAATSEQRTWRARMKTVAAEYIGNFERAAPLVADSSIAAERKRSLLSSAYTASQLHKQTIFGLVRSFTEAYATEAEAAKAAAFELLRTTRTFTSAAAAAAFLFAVVVAVLVIRSFTKGISNLRFAIEKMSIGDLTHTIQSTAQDELGTLSQRYDESVMRMRDLLGETKRVAGALREQSDHFRSFAQATSETNGQIVKAMEEIASGASSQAVQSEENAVIINELDGRLRAISESADVLMQTSAEASGVAQSGTARANAMLDASRRTNESVVKMTEALQQLEKDSSRIADISDTIQSIAKQTNILSLNASIEAARAGAHGKGFSVIAEEVRKLSAQSEESSRRVSALLSNLRAGVANVTVSLQSASASFNDQNVQMEQANDAFQSIIRSIAIFDEQVQHIHQQMDQTTGLQHSIIASIQEVKSIAQQSAAAVQQTAAAASGQNETIGQIALEADQMNRLAVTLFDEINKFAIDKE